MLRYLVMIRSRSFHYWTVSWQKIFTFHDIDWLSVCSETTIPSEKTTQRNQDSKKMSQWFYLCDVLNVWLLLIYMMINDVFCILLFVFCVVSQERPNEVEQCSAWLTVLTVQRWYVHLLLHEQTHRFVCFIGRALHVIVLLSSFALCIYTLLIGMHLQLGWFE